MSDLLNDYLTAFQASSSRKRQAINDQLASLYGERKSLVEAAQPAPRSLGEALAESLVGALPALFSLGSKNKMARAAAGAAGSKAIQLAGKDRERRQDAGREVATQNLQMSRLQEQNLNSQLLDVERTANDAPVEALKQARADDQLDLQERRTSAAERTAAAALQRASRGEEPLSGPAQVAYLKVLSGQQLNQEDIDSIKNGGMSQKEATLLMNAKAEGRRQTNLDFQKGQVEARTTSALHEALPGMKVSEKEKERAVAARTATQQIEDAGQTLLSSIQKNGVALTGEVSALQKQEFSRMVDGLRLMKAQGANFTGMERAMNVDQILGTDLDSAYSIFTNSALGRDPAKVLPQFLQRIERETQGIELNNKQFMPGRQYDQGLLSQATAKLKPEQKQELTGKMGGGKTGGLPTREQFIKDGKLDETAYRSALQQYLSR